MIIINQRKLIVRLFVFFTLGILEDREVQGRSFKTADGTGIGTIFSDSWKNANQDLYINLVSLDRRKEGTRKSLISQIVAIEEVIFYINNRS